MEKLEEQTYVFNIRTLNVIRNWLKVSSLENHKYVKCMYLAMYQQLKNELERNTWVKMVKDVLILLGINGVWLAQGVENKKAV